MAITDHLGNALTTSPEAADAYTEGLRGLLQLRQGSARRIATAVVLDPTFAFGHATLALLGHEMCVQVDIAARLADARLHAARSSERERSHVHAVDRHLQGDPEPLVRHVRRHPRDALLLSVAMPTIAFAGISTVPARSWRIVEEAARSYDRDDAWMLGLLAFVRQEQGRHAEAMELALDSLDREPDGGHAAHARAHAHYETGDHAPGLAWLHDWIHGVGADSEGLTHLSWHAAMHELSLGDLDAVRARYRRELLPHGTTGCRGLVDTGSLLVRWALTPGARDVPTLADVVEVAGRGSLERPATAFLAMHAAVALLADADRAGLDRLAGWCDERPGAHRDVAAPLARALALATTGRCSAAADALADLAPDLWRLGGSDAQREIVEEARIDVLVRAGRGDEARRLLERRLERRASPRDERWRSVAAAV